MRSCKGCLVELLLGLAMLATVASFVWAVETQPQLLEEFGTVTHQAADGEMKESPICAFAMIGIVGSFAIIAAVMLHRAEGKVIEVGDSAGFADPIAPVTQTARAGCGTAFAWLSVLFVCGILAWVFSLVAGGV